MMKKEYDEKSPKRLHTSSSTRAVGTTKNDENDNDSDVKSIEDCIKFLGKKKAYEILAAAVEEEKEFERRVKKTTLNLGMLENITHVNFSKVEGNINVRKEMEEETIFLTQYGLCWIQITMFMIVVHAAISLILLSTSFVITYIIQCYSFNIKTYGYLLITCNRLI